MAKYEDYVKKAAEEKESGTDAEIQQAQEQQEERQTSTPDTNWEERYNALEVAFSRQGQQMGDYRKLIDDYVSTPAEAVIVESAPITSDDIYENPDEAVRRAVDSHPAIQEAKQFREEFANEKAQSLRDAFTLKHPDYVKTYNSAEFANWVNENSMREDLRQRAEQFDLTAADALFTLWETEQNTSVVSQDLDATNAVAAVGLESGTVQAEFAPERFSRSEMLEYKIRAKQGDLAAERYVKAHGAAYRIALGAGQVRD